MIFIRRQWKSVLLAFFCASIAFGLGTKITFNVFSDADKLREHIAEWLIAATVGLCFALLTAYLVEQESQQRIDSDREQYLRDRDALFRTMQDTSMKIIHDTAASVGSSVIGALYSKEIFDCAMESIFSTPLIRREFHHRVAFSVGDTDKVLRVNQTIEYTMQNTSSFVDAQFEAKIVIENASSLYGEEVGYKPQQIKRVEIGGVPFAKSAIDHLNDGINLPNEDGELSTVVPLDTFVIAKQGGTLKVLIVTESQDPIDCQWVWTMFYPLSGLTVEVLNEVEDLHVLLVPVGAYSFNKAVYPFPSTTKNWSRKYDGVLLANTGWNLRWNVVPKARHGLQ